MGRTVTRVGAGVPSYALPMAGPTLPSGDGRAKTALLFGGGLLVTLAAVAALVLLWPDDDDTEVVAQVTTTTVRGGTTTTPGATGEPSKQTTTTAVAEPAEPAQLFEAGADDAVAEMAAAAGRPHQAIQVAVYPTYAFLAYRDPADESHLDRRSWRAGHDQDDAAPNPIYDRVDAETQPRLFPLARVDL